MIRLIVFAFLATLCIRAGAQPPDPREYISSVLYIARVQSAKHGIPVAIILSQAIIESGSGSSRLARSANNHFGIKCGAGWSRKFVRKDDDRPGECFRKYETVEESFEDHSLILTTRSRYSFLFGYGIADYKSWAWGLQRAGYATNPRYAQTLIDCILRYGLDRYQY